MDKVKQARSLLILIIAFSLFSLINLLLLGDMKSSLEQLASGLMGVGIGLLIGAFIWTKHLIRK